MRRKSRALAGSRAAYMRCQGCGHTRLRHAPPRGVGRCTAYVDPGEALTRLAALGSTVCQCPRFYSESEAQQCPTNVTAEITTPLW